MSRSKKIFLVVMILFFLGLILLAIDISRRTLPPGSRKRTSAVHQDPSQHCRFVGKIDCSSAGLLNCRRPIGGT